MDSFIDCISCCEPVTLSELLEQSNDQRLQSLGTIKTLTIKSFTNKSVWGIKHCWNLTELHLVGLTESDFYSFICSLPSIAEAWVLHHGSTSVIESITFDNCVFCQESFEALYHCFTTPCFGGLRSITVNPGKNEKNTRIGEKQWQVICDYLKQGKCPNLESIHLPDNEIGSEGVEALVSLYQMGILKNCHSLDLSCNQIGDKGIISLSQLFANPQIVQTLSYLDISSNRIHHKGFSHFLQYVGSSVFTQLQVLNISYNSLNKENLQNFFEMIEHSHCPQLRSLNLSSIPIKGPVVTALASAIRSNAFIVLEELVMDRCSLTKESLQHLVLSIMDCHLQLLQTLSLANNHLDSEAMRILVPVLQFSILPSLKHLNLSENKIGDEGIEVMNDKEEEAILNQVETLDLSDNGIGNEGAFILFDMIRHKQWKELRDLNLDKNKFTSVTAVQLRSLLEMDNQLEVLRLSDMTKRRVGVVPQPPPKEAEYEFSLNDLVAEDIVHEVSEKTCTTPTACCVC